MADDIKIAKHQPFNYPLNLLMTESLLSSKPHLALMKVFTAAATIPDQNVHIGNFTISFNNSFHLLETICSV